MLVLKQFEGEPFENDLEYIIFYWKSPNQSHPFVFGAGLSAFRNCRKISNIDCSGYFFEIKWINQLSKNVGVGVTARLFDMHNRRNRQFKMCQLFSTVPKLLEKRKRRLQRSISRRYEKNKKGEWCCKTGNIVKSEKGLLKLNHRLTNIRKDYLHQAVSEIIKREPSFICIEDLNVNGMMKNKH